MLFKYLLCLGYILYIPTIVSGLVSTDKQQGGTNGIKSIQNPYRMPIALHAQLTYGKLRPIDGRGIRVAERRTMFFKKHDDAVDVILNSFCQLYPPCLKLISIFNCPLLIHADSIAYSLYRGQLTPRASRPPLYSWLRSLGNHTLTATPLLRRFDREHTLNQAEGCGGEGLTRGAVLARRRRSCPSTQPVIDAEARLAEHGLLSEAREPSRRQDPTVWETFAKHPGARGYAPCVSRTRLRR